MSSDVKYKVRLRAQFGDIGPLEVPGTFSVESLAAEAFESWPKEGFSDADLPASKDEVKLIANGRILQGSESVDTVKKAYFVGGSDESDFLITLHVVVRPPRPPAKNKSKKVDGQQEPVSGCCCTLM